MHPSSTAPLSRPSCQSFGKQELLEELTWFMSAFAAAVERLYGTGAAVLMRSASATSSKSNAQALQATPLWQSLAQLYDYAVDGVLPTVSALGDGSLADVEMFIMGLDGLASYLSEDDGGVPKLAKTTVARAQARQILDGGELYIDLDRHRPSDHLSLAQVALLADMEEQAALASLRRECTADTACAGGQTYVAIDTVRNWLNRCTAFVPTGAHAAKVFHFAKTFSMHLPVDVVRALNTRAAASGVSPFQLLRSIFDREIAEDSLYAANARAALPTAE